MRVQDLLKQFDDFYVLAGEEGLNRNVSTVSVMDAPDIYNWMKGGEFLITTAYVMKDDPLELKDLVIRLNNAGTSALGIKLNRFIKKLPEEVKKVGDQLKFPIIFVPDHYAFTDVINPVLSRIVNTQAKKLERSEKIHRSFTEIAIKGKGTEDIMNTLYRILGKSVAYIDLLFNKNYIRSNTKEFKSDIGEIRLDNLLKKYSSYPVRIGSVLYGYLIVTKEKEDNDGLEKVTIEHASTVLKLEIQKKLSNSQIEQKYRDEFVQDLLMNNIRTKEEVENRAALYGWKMDKGLICITLDIDNFKEKFISIENTRNLEIERDKIFSISRKIMKENFSKVYYTTFSDSTIYLIEPDIDEYIKFQERLQKVLENLREEVRNRSNFTLTIGIGSYKESVMDVYISFIESQKAVRIGRSIYEKDRIVFYSDLGIYNVLYNLSLEEEAKSFCNKNIKSLVDYDKSNNTKYVETLYCLVKNDWNLKSTAEQLFIHYNTMKYRYGKICEVLKLDLNNRETKFNIEFCLRLMSMSDQYSLYMKTNI
ncbi:PucR family transcriptional regulator ligand-binding domain-containing protein [Tissierella sp. MSJ-40]|uniref:PucR family transcriptional regulator ligand-binding domain-containing protein n=1 Tax=Tissierella simiarum TaxID=2841534 RepID=A0ABS6E289_9FIRM|nr:PucR family transcriptional regulator [Tissierella simiarum]MBU5436909.1 PucR family transcriptional regulator ligand-binding domain-containing protein [Tissierella simiarum]